MIIAVDGPAAAGKGSDLLVDIDDGAAIATRFPGFSDLMNGLGADIQDLSE